jgi:hypothetical protein
VKKSVRWQSGLSATFSAALLALVPIIACVMLQVPPSEHNDAASPSFSVVGDVRKIPGSNEFVIEQNCR